VTPNHLENKGEINKVSILERPGKGELKEATCEQSGHITLTKTTPLLIRLTLVGTLSNNTLHRRVKTLRASFTD